MKEYIRADVKAWEFSSGHPEYAPEYFKPVRKIWVGLCMGLGNAIPMDAMPYLTDKFQSDGSPVNDNYMFNGTGQPVTSSTGPGYTDLMLDFALDILSRMPAVMNKRNSGTVVSGLVSKPNQAAVIGDNITIEGGISMHDHSSTINIGGVSGHEGPGRISIVCNDVDLTGICKTAGELIRDNQQTGVSKAWSVHVDGWSVAIACHHAACPVFLWKNAFEIYGCYFTEDSFECYGLSGKRKMSVNY